MTLDAPRLADTLEAARQDAFNTL